MQSVLNLWGVISHYLDNQHLQNVSRVSITGNYLSGVVSVFANSISLNSNTSDQRIDTTSLPASLGAATGLDDGQSGTPTSDFTTNVDTGSTVDGSQLLRIGCLDFDLPYNAAASNYCNGFTPTVVPSEPYLDPTSAFSMNWALTTMPTKIEVLP